jgi:hypothetical protein
MVCLTALLSAASVCKTCGACKQLFTSTQLSFCIATVSHSSGRHTPSCAHTTPTPHHPTPPLQPPGLSKVTNTQSGVKAVPPPTVAAVGQTPAGPGTGTAPSCDREGSLPSPLLPPACAAPHLGGACWAPACPLCGSGATAAAHSHDQRQRHSLQGQVGYRNRLHRLTTILLVLERARQSKDATYPWWAPTCPLWNWCNSSCSLTQPTPAPQSAAGGV